MDPLLQLSRSGGDDDVVIPLRWLPTAGCLAVSVLVDEQFRYLAVVDTGSPFLTAPADIVRCCTRSESKYPPTIEQYGETAGTITWRKARQVLVGGTRSFKSCRIGIVTDELRQDTGGLFCGLIWKDDTRPTFLQQAQYSSFAIDYTARTLTLHSNMQSELSKDDGDVLDMYDLSPFGPDLYHYAVKATAMTISTDQGDFPILASDDDSTTTTTTTSRPIVVVIDTGLTGCILSDSFVNDGCLPVPVTSIQGVRLRVGSDTGPSSTIPSSSRVVLSSEDKYCNLSCFRLPWFYKEEDHPHIVAVGATFLRECKIEIAAKERKIRFHNLQS